MVPRCDAKICRRCDKKRCALRRVFLVEISERKKRYSELKEVLNEFELEDLKQEVYFWKGVNSTRFLRSIDVKFKEIEK